jgi:sulfite exporter TauE/SafE
MNFNTAQTLQVLAAALLIAAGFLNLARARRHAEPIKQKNARLAGWLFLSAGALFLVLALGFRE